MNTNSDCLNFGLDEEHTAHMLFHCEKMKGIIEFYENCLTRNRPDDERIAMNLDMVLFHYIERIECNKRDVTDMLMVTKHVIYALVNFQRHSKDIQDWTFVETFKVFPTQ